MRCNQAPKKAIGLLLCSLLSAGQLALAGALEEPVPLKQPAQSLLSSLIYLGQRSDISIIAPSRLIKGVQASALNGELSPRQALNTLLNDSNLYYQVISDRVVAIRPVEQGPEGSPSRHYILEEVSVIGRAITGSRLRRMDVEGSAAVDIITGAQIAISGSQTLGEFLKYVPAVSGNSTSTAVSNGGDGSASVTLRGMPANNTLVLLNGKRLASKGLRGDAADLNTIPASAIERVEILKDGASAIYGSDAIAGVVNIIMKDDFDGLRLQHYYGQSSRGDVAHKTTSLLWGASNLSTSIILSASATEQDGLFSRDRKISASADGRPAGGVDLRSSATLDPRITLPDETVVSPNADGTYSLADDEALYNYSGETSTISPSEHESLYVSLSHETEDDLIWRVNAGLNRTDARITLAPTPIFTAFERQAISIDADQRYNPFGVQIDDIRRRIAELPNRHQRDRSETLRLSASVDGRLDDLNWSMGANWSRTRSDQLIDNIVDGSLVRQALSGTCQGADIDGCVPLNLFGPFGSISQDQLAYVSTYSELLGNTELLQYTFDMDTSLWDLKSGPMLMAAGAEWRSEKVNTAPTNHESSAELIGGEDISQTIGERRITEVYAEVQVPILNKMRFAHSLDIELAGRISHYSDFGTSANPKFGIRYRPVRDLLVRATYSEGFRAPSISELNQSGSFTLTFLDDPCAQADNVGSAPGCELMSDPTRFQFLTEYGGDEELRPEKSKSRTIGTVWTPASIPNLSLSIDYFRVEQRDVVNASAQFLVNQNAFFNRYQDLVIRDDNGNISQINATFMNIGNRDVSGVDIALDYQWHSTEWGIFTVEGNASHMAQYRHQIDPEGKGTDQAGKFSDEASEGNGALPEWKANIGFQWMRGGLDVSYTVHYTSALEEEIPESSRLRDIKSWQSHDLQMNYQPKNHRALTFTLGADNLLDTAPPFSAAAFNDNYDSRTHDIKGRFWYARLSYSFY